MQTILFPTREILRTKLRDILVDGVRSGVLDGDKAKGVAEDIVDTLELAPEERTPMELFLELDGRYPDILAPLKSEYESMELRMHDAHIAAQMEECIARGSFQDAISVAHGGQVAETVAVASTPLPPTQPMVDSISAPVATAVAAPPAAAQNMTQTTSSALNATLTFAASTTTTAGGRARALAGGFLRGIADAIQRSAERLAPPPSSPMP